MTNPPVDPRVAFLRAAIRPGDSFCDVGGVEKREMTPLARECGATYLSMIDIRPFTDVMWEQIPEGVSRHAIAIENYAGLPFDVVHCGSVLHHVADPAAVLAGLRRATGRECILTAVVCDNGRRDDLEALTGPGIPGLNAEPTGALTDWRWLPDAAELVRAIEAAGFTITRDSGRHWHGFLLTMRLT